MLKTVHDIVPLSVIYVIEDDQARAFKEHTPKAQELKKSIAKHGVTDPILLEKRKDKNGSVKLCLIGGRHRFEFSKQLGYETIPAIIIDEELSRKDAIALASHSNIHIQMDPVEHAKQLERILEEDDSMSEPLLAELYGCTVQTIEEYLNINKLYDHIKDDIRRGLINATNARRLAKTPEELWEELYKLAATHSTTDFKEIANERQKLYKSQGVKRAKEDYVPKPRFVGLNTLRKQVENPTVAAKLGYNEAETKCFVQGLQYALCMDEITKQERINKHLGDLKEAEELAKRKMKEKKVSAIMEYQEKVRRLQEQLEEENEQFSSS